LRRDEIPAVLLGNVSDTFFAEIVEHPLVAKRDRKIRLDFSILDITIYRFGLYIHHPDELDLRDHILDAVLPVEKVDDLIVRHIDRHIQPCFGLFTLEQYILIQLALVLRRQHIRHGLIFCNVQHPMQTVGHIEHIGVVHKVNHQQILFPRAAACATVKLLQIDCFGHGRACHEQHRGMRTIPALIQQVTGTKNIRRTGFVIFQDLIPDFYPVTPGNSLCFHPIVAQQLRNLRRMIYTCAKNHSLLAIHVLQIGINNQLIALRNEQLTFQILRVLFNTIDSHIG